MGPKKTKKQIEEEKAAAEAERLKQEEEERKRKAEEEERRRIQEEKRKAEEEKRQKEEKIRLDEQTPIYEDRASKMHDYRAQSKNTRIQDLDEKYLACNPLPDPDNEKDLTTFIRLWEEQKDKTLLEALNRCQTAEDVIASINLKLGEAMAQCNYDVIKWCQVYIDELRKITLRKFDSISVEILTYFENYTKPTEEEIETEKAKNPGRMQNFNQKSEVYICNSSKDVLFGIWANASGRSMQFKTINYNDRFITQLPSKNQSEQLIMRCVWTSYDYVSSRKFMQESDDIVVGGVCHNRMYEPPFVAKQTNKWNMRQIHSTDDTLRLKPFPMPGQAVASDPVQAEYRLPDYVYVHQDDKPCIGIWDEEKQEWSTDDISDLSFDPKSKLLKFGISRFAPFAYLQPKILDYPYDSWYIRSTEDQVAILTINTKRMIEINIEIHPLHVKLIEMKEPELKHLVDKPMHPGLLLQELSRSGIHLLPEEADAARADIHVKDVNAEERAIADIAQTLKAFAFQSIKWNQAAPKENIVCRVRENPDYFRQFLEDDESDWKSLCWWNNKVSYIKARNCDESYDGDFLPGNLTHIMLSQAVNGVQSEQAAEKSQACFDIDFIDNVSKTLRLTKLLSFTVNHFDKRTLEEQQQ